MKIMINATNLKSGGALQVAGSLFQSWSESSQNHEFHFVCGPALAHLKSYTPHVHCYYYPKHPSYLSVELFRFRKYMGKLEQSIKADVVLTVFGPSLWRPKANHLCGFANGIYLFHNDPYIEAAYPPYRLKFWKYAIYRSALLYTLRKNADAFWVETITAQLELQKNTGFQSRHIHVVGNTYPEILSYHEKSTATVPQLLMLSAYYPHKNFELIPKIIGLLSERKLQVCFLLTLPENTFSELAKSVTDQSYLKNLGPIATEQIQAAYDRSDIVFIPSLLETFSSNFPEAMQSGKPIICSDRSFAKDICNDAALYFDPLSATDAVQKIEKLVQDPNLQEQLKAKGFARLQQMETPHSRAEKLLKLLVQLKENGPV
jgi:glycosyltransferase involved in cell wall biosynthesis